MRPPKPISQPRSITRIASRTRNLERRFDRGGSGALANASWIAPETFPNQNIAANTEAQVTMHDGTFVTTDADVFESGTNKIVVKQAGLYLALAHVVCDPTSQTLLATSLSIRWRTASDAGDEQVVPRDFSRSDSGGTLSVPNGDTPTTTDWVEALSWAYVAAEDTGTEVSVWLFNQDTGILGINPADRLFTVIQVCAIDAATILGYPAFPA